MIFDYALAGAVAFGLLIYLTYALLRPERFWPCCCSFNCCWLTLHWLRLCSRCPCRCCAGP